MSDLENMLKAIEATTDPALKATLENQYKDMLKKEEKKAKIAQRANKKKERLAKGHSVDNSAIEQMRKYVYVAAENKMVNFTNNIATSLSGFEILFQNYMPEENVLKFALGNNLKKGQLDLPKVEDRLFYPIGDFPVFSIKGTDYLNTFNPNVLVQPSEDWQSTSGWKVIRDHLLNNIEEGGEHIINWMAYCVQNPGEKISWSPLIHGPQGTGKTLLGKVVGSRFNGLYVNEITQRDIDDKFDDWATGSIIGLFEEVKSDSSKGTTRQSIMNKLKVYLTNPMISIRGLGKAHVTVKNFVNYIAFTNYIDALALEQDDRRWFVVKYKWKNSADMRTDIDNQGMSLNEYFAPMWNAVENEKQHLVGWLMSIDLTDFDNNFCPEPTKARNIMVSKGGNWLEQFIEEIIADGTYGVGENIIVASVIIEQASLQRKKVVTGNFLADTLVKMGYDPYTERSKQGFRVEITTGPYNTVTRSKVYFSYHAMKKVKQKLKAHCKINLTGLVQKLIDDDFKKIEKIERIISPDE